MNRQKPVGYVRQVCLAMICTAAHRRTGRAAGYRSSLDHHRGRKGHSSSARGSLVLAVILHPGCAATGLGRLLVGS